MCFTTVTTYEQIKIYICNIDNKFPFISEIAVHENVCQILQKMHENLGYNIQICAFSYTSSICLLIVPP